MLARALALRPSVLLLDEPTSALDETTKAAIEATLREARDPSACLLFSSSTTSTRPSGSPTGFLCSDPGALREASAAAAPNR